MTTDPPGKTGLLAGADVVKYLTALGTGAIVFSAGLLSEKIFLSTASKWFIFFSWCFLALSVLGGLLAGMRIPVQLTEQNYDLEDPYLKWPGLAQQVAFFIGIIFLGIGLTIILVRRVEPQPSKEDSTVSRPSPEPTSLPTGLPTPTPVPSPAPSAQPSQHEERKRPPY
jgi:hypothetical protein